MNRTLYLLFGMLVGGLSAIPAYADYTPKTLAEANAHNTTQGWSAVTMANGSPAALYRGKETTNPQQLAIGCSANAQIIAAGGPATAMRVSAPNSDVVFAFGLAKTAAHLEGADQIFRWMDVPNMKLALGESESEFNDAKPTLAQVNKFCQDSANLQISTGKIKNIVDDVTWHSNDSNTISYAVADSDAYQGIEISCRNSDLVISSIGVPKGSVDKSKAILQIETDTITFDIVGVAEITTDGMDSERTTVTIGKPATILNALETTTKLRVKPKGLNYSAHSAIALQALLSGRLVGCR